MEHADARLRARLPAAGEGLPGVEADRGDGGEHAHLRLPGLEAQALLLDVEAVPAIDRRDLEACVPQAVRKLLLLLFLLVFHSQCA